MVPPTQRCNTHGVGNPCVHAEAVRQAVVAAGGHEDEGPGKVVLSPDLLTGVPVVARRKVEAAAARGDELSKAKAEELRQTALEGACRSTPPP